jgi:hypothetical protein
MGPPPHMMDMGMGRPYDDGPPGPPPPFQGGGPGRDYGPGPMGGPGMGPPPGMGAPPPGIGPRGGDRGGGAPQQSVGGILSKLSPEQREQFQRLMTLSPEQVRSGHARAMWHAAARLRLCEGAIA